MTETNAAPRHGAPAPAVRVRDRTALLTKARLLARRSFDELDRRAFPEAAGAEDQWQRVAMNEAVDGFIETLPVATLTAAEISGDSRADAGWSRHESLNYPDFDLLDPVPDDLRFDVVFCEQVLEHVDDPFLAARNLRTLCAPGGRLVVTSPFLVKVHELPMYGMHDYWRFTPRGLRVLLERAGFTVDEVGGWGNRMCVVGNLSRWSTFRRWHPMSNEDDIPVQLWAYAHVADPE